MKTKKMIGLVAMAATLMFAACGDDEKNEQNQPTPNPQEQQEQQEQPESPIDENGDYNLKGTEWTGKYVQEVTYMDMPLEMTLTWTVDFMDEKNVSLLLEISSPASDTQNQDLACTYSVKGTVGTIYSGNATDTFDIDPVNRTITMDMQTQTRLGDADSEMTILGGITVLHQVL